MSMQWVTLRQAQEDAGGTAVVTQHWYLTEDKTRVVPEGDVEGRWLWASPGTAVALSDAIRYGAVKVEPEPEKSAIEQLVEDGADPDKVAKAVQDNPLDLDKPLEGEPPADPPAEEKQAPKAANKARKQAPNKAATPSEEDK